MSPTIPPSFPTAIGPNTVPNAARIGKDLETHFLAEMLKLAGLGSPRSDFGGASAEAQFMSFLTRARAEQITAAGGIGLAETFLRGLDNADSDA